MMQPLHGSGGERSATGSPACIHASLQLRRPGFELDVGFALPNRGVTALFGPSGAGKTTVLRVLAGLEVAAQGRIEVDGQCWFDSAQRFTLPAHARPVAYVFQDGRLFPHLDVQGNLRFALQRAPARSGAVTMEHAIRLLDLAPLLQRSVETLSGGERQRVALARALLANPRLLLLDEPLAALDTARRHELLDLLERVLDTLDLSVLLVSHALDEVLRLAPRMLLLHNGRLVAHGPTAELCTRLDLSLAHGDAAAAVLEATVLDWDATDHLARLGFAGGTLWLPMAAAQIGRRVRLRVQARDVSLILQRPSDSSVLNLLPATVQALSDDAPGQSMVALDLGGSTLLARVTQRSVRALQLTPGRALVAQIKGVAILG